jgi:hypothetical protein
MTSPSPFEISSNSDGTITLSGKVLDGPAAAALVADILAYMSEATEKSGQMIQAKQLDPREQIHAVRPNMIAAAQAAIGDDQRLLLICGHAHLGVVVPSHIVRALGESFLALSVDERKQH